MIQKLIYILTFFAYSCEEIQETTEELPYDFLISEGWQSFEDGDFDLSEDLFLDILDFDEGMIPYYSAAYLGLGWTKLYQAKQLSSEPVNNSDTMEDFRVSANSYFNLILNECSIQDESGLCSNLDIPEYLILHTYAGLSYSNSLLAMYEDINDRFSCSSTNQIHEDIEECEENCVFYGCSLNEELYSDSADCESGCVESEEEGTTVHGSCTPEPASCLNASIPLTNIALNYSEFINDNPNYYFTYDPDNINANSIHILRAQLYIDIGDYEAAENEIFQVDFVTTDITFTLSDSYEDPYNSYNRYLYVGFEGENNSKHYIPMDTDFPYYDCYYSCDSITDQENCLDGCQWLDATGCQEEISDMYIDYNSCESTCIGGECQASYSSSVMVAFTPLLPCLYTYEPDIEIDFTDEEIVQCLESFPTNTLEYKFAIKFPVSIVEGYECTEGTSTNDDISTFYITEQGCIDNCSNGECQIVDFDYANCASQTDLEFIDGIGCIDSYMYSMEEIESDVCSNGFRLIDIIQPGLPLSSSSFFDHCISD